MEKGLVILYTGEGKGKTTAALGLVLRAVGYRRKCLIMQFGKAWFTGEIKGVEKLSPYVKLIQGGKGFVNILGDRLPLTVHQKAAQEAFEILFRQLGLIRQNLFQQSVLRGRRAGQRRVQGCERVRIRQRL